MLGGIMYPRKPEAHITAVEYRRSYPYFSIRGIMTAPVAAIEANPEPVRAANMREVTTQTAASPPLSFPTKTYARRISGSAIPPWLII